MVVVCFFASLLPFLFPGAVIGLFGKLLNDALGTRCGISCPPPGGLLVTARRGGPCSRCEGVLAVYVPALVILLWLQRRR